MNAPCLSDQSRHRRAGPKRLSEGLSRRADLRQRQKAHTSFFVIGPAHWVLVAWRLCDFALNPAALNAETPRRKDASREPPPTDPNASAATAQLHRENK